MYYISAILQGNVSIIRWMVMGVDIMKNDEKDTDTSKRPILTNSLHTELNSLFGNKEIQVTFVESHVYKEPEREEVDFDELCKRFAT